MQKLEEVLTDINPEELKTLIKLISWMATEHAILDATLTIMAADIKIIKETLAKGK